MLILYPKDSSLHFLEVTEVPLAFFYSVNIFRRRDGSFLKFFPLHSFEAWICIAIVNLFFYAKTRASSVSILKDKDRVLIRQ